MKITKSKATLWTGRIISVICVLFLLMDSIMKVVIAPPTIQGSAELGWPVNAIQITGIVLLACTILYIIPRTAILGAVLLTGYLGGAVAIMVRASSPGHPYLFPIAFGTLVWTGLLLRDYKIRSVIFLILRGKHSVETKEVKTGIHLAH